MASLLFFEERLVSNPALSPESDDPLGPGPAPPAPPTDKALRQYRIISDNARTLLGTIYLPAGRLIVDSKKPVADQSAYTVVVAQLINVYEGPNLFLNARCGNTDIPFPVVSGRVRPTRSWHIEARPSSPAPSRSFV